MVKFKLKKIHNITSGQELPPRESIFDYQWLWLAFDKILEGKQLPFLASFDLCTMSFQYIHKEIIEQGGALSLNFTILMEKFNLDIIRMYAKKITEKIKDKNSRKAEQKLSFFFMKDYIDIQEKYEEDEFALPWPGVPHRTDLRLYHIDFPDTSKWASEQFLDFDLTIPFVVKDKISGQTFNFKAKFLSLKQLENLRKKSPHIYFKKYFLLKEYSKMLIAREIYWTIEQMAKSKGGTREFDALAHCFEYENEADIYR